MITFSQKLISIRDNMLNICWIVENTGDKVIYDAVAFSNSFNHNFGCLGIGDIKTVSFRVPAVNMDLMDSAVMNYSTEDDVYIVESNILRNI